MLLACAGTAAGSESVASNSFKGETAMTSAAVVVALLLAQQQGAPPTRAAGPEPTAAAIAADTGALRHPSGRVPPVVTAVRAAGGAPRIDGRLDDAVWVQAEPASRFTQRSPLDGQPATESTVVRVAYDDEAIYIGARMYDSEPNRIVAELGRRDGGLSDDHFEFAIDSYHDHRTAFFFKVSTLGVRSDGLYSDDGEGYDMSWDPVWGAAARRDSLGWTAECRIPLSQLRFPNSPAHVWGINFNRYIRRNAEDDFWSYVGQTDQGYSSFFGHLFGIADIPQPRRLELLPYASAVEERLASGSPENPFDDGSTEVGRAGLDLKYGLASNVTLDATVNPDFGQVEADPAVVNLTAYETYFEERRPFFVERGDIFSGGNQQYFYSRRIGRRPQRDAAAPDSGFADQPSSTTILGAGKLTGRTAGGWSVGLLEAATAREYAALSDADGVRTREIVEPFTNYAVVRAKRDFRSGASTFGLIGTAVNRRIDDASLDFLRSSAYAGGADFSHRFSSNRFRLSGSLGFSYIGGDTAAIRRAQVSSARYFQRPDAGHVVLDPLRTSITGWTGSLAFARVQGNVNYSVSAAATSPGFEINDLGFQTRADRIATSASVTRLWTRPGRLFRHAELSAGGGGRWNYDGDRVSSGLMVDTYVQFLNWWGVMASFSAGARAVSDDLTRGGPLAVAPAEWSTGLRVISDPRKRTSLTGGGNAFRNELGGWYLWGFTSLSWRPAPMVSVELGPELSASLNRQQYLQASSEPAATAMFGGRYVFADVLQHGAGLSTRLNVTFSPNLSLQFYVQPFVATADYRRFKELRRPRSTDYLVYGEASGSTIRDSLDARGLLVGHTLDPDGVGPRDTTWIDNPDFSYRSLRGNAVLRWEYRPGSTLFLVWTTSCESVGSSPRFDALGDMGRLCRGRRSDSVFAVKLNYWLSLLRGAVSRQRAGSPSSRLSARRPTICPLPVSNDGEIYIDMGVRQWSPSPFSPPSWSSRSRRSRWRD